MVKERAVMKRLLSRLVREEDGQDLIEYGLLVGVITIGAIVAIAAISPTVAGYFASLNAALP
jgi:pilus assembly protein Flp/PilA